MRLRKRYLLLAIPALILAAGLGSWSWLMHSEPGARWLFSKLQSSGAGTLDVSSLSGDLATGLQLSNLSFDGGATQVNIGHLKIAVDIDLLPVTVTLESLHADTVVVRATQESSQETDLETTIAGLALPVPLRFSDIRISGLEYFAYAEENALIVNSASAKGSLHRELELEKLSVAIPGNTLTGSGRMGLTAPYPVSLELQATGEFIVRGNLDGSLESSNIALNSELPLFQANGTLKNLLAAPGWDLEISSKQLEWPLADPAAESKLSNLQAHSSGEWPRFKLEVTGVLEVQGLEPSALGLAGEGDSDGFSVSHLSLDGPELALHATGSVAWKDQLQLAMNAALERLDPAKWLNDWPEDHPANGEFTLQWSGEEITVPGFKLAVANTALVANGQGTFDPEAGVLDAELSWSGLDWPLGSPSPTIVSRNGQFTVSGQPDNWQLDGKLFIQSADFPEGQLRLGGSGDTESASLTIHEASILGGKLSGKAGWNWTGSQPFTSTLKMESIDVAPLFPQYPAVLSSQLTATGAFQPFSIDVSIQHLEGSFKTYPISAHGGVHVEQNLVYADELKVTSGTSMLSLDGSLYGPGGMEFSANISSLAGFSDDFSGTLITEGKLSLDPASPKFSATVSGRQLVLGPVEIAQIETREASGSGLTAGREIVFSGLVAGQRPIDSLVLRFSGQQPLQEVQLSASIEGTEISMALNGSVNDWSDPVASGWNGALTALDFDLQQRFQLALEDSAKVTISPAYFNLEQACLRGTREAFLCVESSWKDTDELSVTADLAAIPLGLVELFTDTDLAFTQILSGSVNWVQSAQRRRNGSVRIELSPGAIQDIDDREVLLETGPGLFAFELASGQLRKGGLELNFPGVGDIDLNLNIPDISAGRDSQILGSARVDLNDIGLAGKLFNLFDTVDGVLDVDLGLSGTLSDPAFNGSVILSDGRIQNTASGFSFSEINLAGEISQFDRSELNGSFRAGEGNGEINASIYFEEILSPVVKLALKGDSLTLIDVPDLKLVANPDLGLTWANNVLEINGRLVIPSARLSPSFLPQSAVEQSQDVVIVAGELPVKATDKPAGPAMSVRGMLEVELGDQVVIDLDLAQVGVTGATKFSWNNGLIPIANGEFHVAGDIEAYGQFLKITQGRISFPGIPADNPHLNIRAEREIYGNTQVRKAGLMVAGTLRRPLTEAYTVPMTNKERAQTLLVTGSDFNYEQGVGAVDVGMYVLPRLHISYGIGVFEDGNVLKARYDLGRGFGVRATSGQRETGLDISYTIER